ncbi:hypothetical protein ACFL04_03725 [Patescibacteria group bacterium]
MSPADDKIKFGGDKEAARQLRQDMHNTPGVTIPASTSQADKAGDEQGAARNLRQAQRQDSQANPTANTRGATPAISMRGRLNQARQALRTIRQPKQALNAAIGGAEEISKKAIIGAQRRLWSIAHEALEDVTLAFWPLAFIVGCFAVALLVIRVVLAYIVRDLFTISFGGMTLPIAPTFSFVGGVLRFKGVLAYGVWALEWAIIAIIIILLQDIPYIPFI